MASSDPAPDDAKPGVIAESAAVLTEAIQQEHELTFMEAVKLYPSAVGWSAFVSIGVIMLAFDPQLLGNLYATPQFQRDFGYEYNGEVSCQLIVLLDACANCHLYSISLV